MRAYSIVAVSSSSVVITIQIQIQKVLRLRETLGMTNCFLHNHIAYTGIKIRRRRGKELSSAQLPPGRTGTNEQVETVDTRDVREHSFRIKSLPFQ